MTRNKSMSMKAMFLLVVFLLNTVTGFACAIGMDMGYNKHQHAELEHHDKDHTPKHSHEKDEDNCCKDAVAKLTASDKLTQRVFDVSQLTIPFIIIPGVTYQYDRGVSLPVNIPNSYFSHHCRSPIPDVRIAIQSFQI